MASAFSLSLPQPKALTAAEELPLLEMAHAQRAEGYALKLAQSLYRLRRDAEVIDLLSNDPLDGADEFTRDMLLGLSHLGRNGDGDAPAAQRYLVAAARSAPDQASRAAALSELGKSHFVLGELPQARHALDAALAEDERTPYGLLRMASLDLLEHRERDLLDRSAVAMAGGISDASILAGRYLALSALSQTTLAADFEAMDELLWQGSLPTPEGWESIEAFNSALAGELLDHPGRSRPRRGAESNARWRVDDLLLDRSHLVPVLLRTLQEQIERQIRTLAGNDHVWCRARPPKARLHIWSMTTHDDAFDAWHMHVRGWMSGVYYVQIPDQRLHDAAGCIEFGIPEIDGIDRQLPGERRRIRPGPGQLLLFPSHLHHRTHPTGSSDRRISVAFDIVPDRRPGAGNE